MLEGAEGWRQVTKEEEEEGPIGNEGPAETAAH